MPHERCQTQKRRKMNTVKSGRKAKRKIETVGSTPKFPLEGPIPTVKAGFVVEADSIKTDS